jgi:hypothetical protein
MSTAPLLDGAEDLVTLHMDGLFYDSDKKTNNAEINKVTPPRLENSHSEQIWIH